MGERLAVQVADVAGGDDEHDREVQNVQAGVGHALGKNAGDVLGRQSRNGPSALVLIHGSQILHGGNSVPQAAIRRNAAARCVAAPRVVCGAAAFPLGSRSLEAIRDPESEPARRIVIRARFHFRSMAVRWRRLTP
ncbi:MAG: hypothetical protein ACHP7N_06340 [Caulobacterales bacterium]